MVGEIEGSGNTFLARVAWVTIVNEWEWFELQALSCLSRGRSFVVAWFDLVVEMCGDQSFELELDMEVSAKWKAHCTG